MPTLWGVEHSREELGRRIGRLEQVAGVRLVTLGDGMERGVRVLEFRTGSGFAFDVLVDRAFDIGHADVGGIPLSWTSPVGVSAPWYYEPDDWGWFRSWGGGLVVTCGLDHTMSPASDSALAFGQPHMFERLEFGLHGRIGGLPARLVGYGEAWEGDTCVLWAEGVVHQASVFGEHLVLRRRIEAPVGGRRLVIHDRVENAGHSVTSHMLLYHCNLGYPVVSDGSELLLASDATRTDPWETIEGYRTLPAPQPQFQEACFYERSLGEPDGTVPAAVVNRRLAIGVYQLSNARQLPELMVWRMPGEGTYAVALEPGTNRALPRDELREHNEIVDLMPGDARAYDLELGALVGSAEIDAFAARVGQARTRAPDSREQGQ